MRIIAIIVALLFIISCNNITSRINEVPLLIVTDFGRDVDDAQAFAFLAEQINGETNILDIITNKKGFTSKHNGIKPIIAGVICTGYIPEVRAKTLKHFLSLYNISALIAIPTDREKDSIYVDYYYKTHLL